MAKVNNNYGRNIKPLWKLVNGSIKSSCKNTIHLLMVVAIVFLVMQVRSKS